MGHVDGATSVVIFHLVVGRTLTGILVLSVGQFQRFMGVIRKLGERVEKEHNQFLRDSQRIEDRSSTADNLQQGTSNASGNVDFESLVGRANGASVKADTVIDSNPSWDDDVWGSIFTSGPEVSEWSR